MTPPPAPHQPARGDEGSVSVWLIGLALSVIAILALMTGGGAAITAKQEASTLADEAARAAVDSLSPDAYRQGLTLTPAEASAAASGWVADHAGQATQLRGANATTSMGPGEEVTVTVTGTYTSAALSFIGVGTMNISATGNARAAYGVTTEVPSS